MSDPRLIVIDDTHESYLDPRFVLWQEVEAEPTGEPPPSFQTINQNPGGFGPVYVRWQVANAQLTEGAYNHHTSTRIFNAQLVGIGPQGAYVRTYPTDLYVNARVTGGTATAGTDFHMASAQEAIGDYDYLTLRFPQGSSSAALVVWAKTDGGAEGSEDIEITLDPTGVPSYVITGSPSWVAPDAAVAGPDVLTIDVIDAATPVTPEWSWVGGVSVSYPETAGDVILEVALDGPSETETSIQFSVSGGTAVAGTNYVALDPSAARVSLDPGVTIGHLVVRLLFDPATASPDLDITGVVIAGDCTDPAADTLTLEILDVAPTARTVQWAASTLFYPEPDDPANEVTQIIFCTVTQAFTSQTDVPYELVESNIAAGVGYTISGGAGVPAGYVRFAPNATQAFLRFRPLANGVVDDGTVTLTLEDGGSLYGLGTNDEIVITILENSGGALEPTYLAGPRGVRTGRTVIEATMAVVPPSETLPQYFCANNGDACQVVGLARNSQGRWDAVRVLAITDDDVAGAALTGAQASYPGITAAPIEIQLGSGSTPAENGAYHAEDFSVLVPSIIPCNTSSTEFLRTLNESQASSTTAIVPQWVGPTDAMFPQEGADLVRIEYYRVVLRMAGDVTSDGLTAPDPDTRCMSVEMWIKRRVDCDVVEVEGVLTNTNRDKKQSVLGPDSRSSGTVNLLSFEIKDVPAGWAATWSVANPNESFAAGTITLLPARAEAYEFPPTATMPFRFALYNTVSSSAAEAQRILRYRHTAVSTGHYGVTRNNCWGVWGDVLLDPVRAGYYATWGGTQYEGWLAFEQTGAQYVAKARTGWDTGTNGYPRLDDRLGWFQSAHPTNYQSPGGNAINGQTALIPSTGYWEDSWFAIAASIMRQRVGMKDVVSGDEAWQQSLVDEYGHASGYAPLVQAGNDRLGMARLPQFNTDTLVETSIPGASSSWPFGSTNIHGAATSFGCKAPTTRPWNTDEGTRDPDWLDLSHETPQGYQHTDFSHCARYREQIEDAWWGAWSPLAWWQSMHLGAWVSRGMSAHLVDPANYGQPQHGSIEYIIWDQHVGNIVARAESLGSPLEKGRPYVGNIGFINGWWPVGNVRMFGHAPTLIAQAYAIGGDRQRAWIVPANGPNWFESWATFITDYSTPIGVFASEGFANIDPHAESVWGPTNLANRTGATPPSTSTPVPPATRYHAALLFHQNFISFGAWAVYWRGLKNVNSTLQVALRKVLRTPYYVRESARPWTSQQGPSVLGSYAVPARGNFAPGSITGFPTVPDAGTFMSSYWHDFSRGSALAVEHAATHAPHFGVCVYAWREARDQEDPEADQYLTPALAFFGVPGDELAPDWEQVRDIAYARLLAQTNASNSGNVSTLQQNLHGGNTTFLAAFINEMVNRTT